MAKATEINLMGRRTTNIEILVSTGNYRAPFSRTSSNVLELPEGKTTTEIAQTLQKRQATVSKWRTPFSQFRLAGLEDAPRPGKAANTNQEQRKKILTQLDCSPPAGYATWDGKLCKSFGRRITNQVGVLLRKHGIHLQRRHSGVLVRSAVYAKSGYVVGLYLNPP